MNSDIRISIGFLDHPKTMKLKRELGWEGIESLMRLWFFSAQYKPDGVLSSMDSEEIEMAAKWNGRPGLFSTTLQKLRLIDQDDGVFILHDWDDHNSFCVHAAERRDQARRAAEKRWKMRFKNADSNADSNDPSNPPIPTPIPTPIPNPKEEKQKLSASADAVREQNVYVTKRKRKLTGHKLESFNQFWDAFAYPRGKAEAADAWLDIPCLENGEIAKICEAAKREADMRKTALALGRTPKMAQGWLNGRRWEDETIADSFDIDAWSNEPLNPDPWST